MFLSVSAEAGNVVTSPHCLDTVVDVVLKMIAMVWLGRRDRHCGCVLLGYSREYLWQYYVVTKRKWLADHA